MKTYEWNGRYALLVFDCIMGFGVFFCQDIPGALQTHIQGLSIPCNISSNVTSNVTCCEDCLGLGPDRYNNLYSAYSWMSAILALPGGYIIDRIGNREGFGVDLHWMMPGDVCQDCAFVVRAGAVAVSSISTIGSAIFAIAISFGIRGSEFMFPLMIAGRLFLGTSAGCTLIVQDRIVAFWFGDKMALAFGITYTTERLGNVVNFFVTDNIFSLFGLRGAFVAGAMVCFCSFCGAVIFALLDIYGTKKLDKESQANMVSIPIKAGDVKRFPLAYWLIACMISSYYSCFIPYVGNGSKFIQDKYGLPEKEASYINGGIYDTCCILFPLLGIILDKKGGRSWILLVATYITVPIFPLIYYINNIHPLVFCVWLGIVYTVAILCLWSLVAIIVPPTSLGTACGIATFLQGLGMGLTNLGIGEILKNLEKSSNQQERLERWKWVLILLMAISGFCAACGTLLHFSNKTLLKKMNGIVSVDNQNNDEEEKIRNDENQNERKRLLANVIESDSYSSIGASSVENNYAVQ